MHNNQPTRDITNIASWHKLVFIKINNLIKQLKQKTYQTLEQN